MIPSGIRVFVAVQPADMRCSVRGLSRLVRERFGEEVDETGALYVFVNKRRDRAKVLWRTAPGWTVLYRVLDKRVITAVSSSSDRVSLDGRELAQLLSGIPRRATRREVARAAREKVRV